MMVLIAVMIRRVMVICNNLKRGEDDDYNGDGYAGTNPDAIFENVIVEVVQDVHVQL